MRYVMLHASTKTSKNVFIVPYCTHCSKACGLLVDVGCDAVLCTCANLYLLHGSLVQANSTCLAVLPTLLQVLHLQ
jgi:thiazole synthase ThiGH ThiG subunit